MQPKDINYLLGRQQLLLQAQALAIRFPEMGITINELALQPFDELEGNLAFLRNIYVERES